MKRKFLAFIALIAVACSLSSCLSSDDTTVEYTYDTAITSFSLGSLDKYTKTAAGKDTLLKAKVTGSNYKFYIDQTTRQIYNVDSLPYGVRDSAVLATISSKNSSPIILMDINKEDSMATYYSSSDSINFSKPRKMRVYNNAMTAYVTYTVTVNVHQEQDSVFNWTAKAQGDAQLAALSDQKILATGNNWLYVFGKTAEGTKVYKSSIFDGINWTEMTPDVSLSAEAYKNAVLMGDSLYILSGGKVYASADGEEWQQRGEDSQIQQLVGTSGKRLYAYTAAGISVSTNGGASWAAQKLDADRSLLPTNNLSINASSIASVKNMENLLLLGTRDAAYGDTIATLWNHTADYTQDAQANAWNYIDYDANQRGKLPMMDEVLACTADSGFVALGSNGKWYSSKNGGLTWKADTIVTLPAAFAASTKRFGFCRDIYNYYWIVRNGSVWKGRYNRDGWRKETTIFE